MIRAGVCVKTGGTVAGLKPVKRVRMVRRTLWSGRTARNVGRRPPHPRSTKGHADGAPADRRPDPRRRSRGRRSRGGHPPAVPRRAAGRPQARPEPRHHRRPHRRAGHARRAVTAFSRPRHPRRGIRPGQPARQAALGARPDRRHPRLHHRPPGVRHPDRPARRRHAHPRPDRPMRHRRALDRRRRPHHHLPRQLRRHRRLPALPNTRRSRAVLHQSGDVRRRPAGLGAAVGRRAPHAPSAATAMPMGWSRSGSSTSSPSRD